MGIEPAKPVVLDADPVARLIWLMQRLEQLRQEAADTEALVKD